MIQFTSTPYYKSDKRFVKDNSNYSNEIKLKQCVEPFGIRSNLNIDLSDKIKPKHIKTPLSNIINQRNNFSKSKSLDSISLQESLFSTGYFSDNEINLQNSNSYGDKLLTENLGFIESGYSDYCNKIRSISNEDVSSITSLSWGKESLEQVKQGLLIETNIDNLEYSNFEACNPAAKHNYLVHNSTSQDDRIICNSAKHDYISHNFPALNGYITHNYPVQNDYVTHNNSAQYNYVNCNYSAQIDNVNHNICSQDYCVTRNSPIKCDYVTRNSPINQYTIENTDDSIKLGSKSEENIDSLSKDDFNFVSKESSYYSGSSMLTDNSSNILNSYANIKDKKCIFDDKILESCSTNKKIESNLIYNDNVILNFNNNSKQSIDTCVNKSYVDSCLIQSNIDSLKKNKTVDTRIPQLLTNINQATILNKKKSIKKHYLEDSPLKTEIKLLTKNILKEEIVDTKELNDFEDIFQSSDSNEFVFNEKLKSNSSSYLYTYKSDPSSMCNNKFKHFKSLPTDLTCKSRFSQFRNFNRIGINAANGEKYTSILEESKRMVIDLPCLIGADKVDFLHELFLRNMWEVIGRLFDYLDDRDLCRTSCVSKYWSKSIECHLPTLNRKTKFIKELKKLLSSKFKENRIKIKKTLSSRDLTTGNPRGPMTVVQQIAAATSPPKNMGEENRFSNVQIFWKAAKELQSGEDLRKCIRCQYVAKPAAVVGGVAGARIYTCTRLASCGVSFCSACRVVVAVGGSVSAHKCASMSDAFSVGAPRCPSRRQKSTLYLRRLLL